MRLLCTPTNSRAPEDLREYRQVGHRTTLMMIQPLGARDAGGISFPHRPYLILPVPQRNSISRGNLRGRSPPLWALTTCIAFVHPNGKESSEWRHYRYLSSTTPTEQTGCSSLCRAYRSGR